MLISDTQEFPTGLGFGIVVVYGKVLNGNKIPISMLKIHWFDEKFHTLRFLRRQGSPAYMSINPKTY